MCMSGAGSFPTQSEGPITFPVPFSVGTLALIRENFLHVRCSHWVLAYWAGV